MEKIDIPNNNNNLNKIKKSNENKLLQQKEIKINNLYMLETKNRLGSGSFGQIFKGHNIKTKEEVAIKIESNNSTTPQLMHEYKVLKNLKDGIGFPQIFLLTPLDDTLVMVMELFGDNLEKLMKNLQTKNFSQKTVLMATLQILQRIQFMHENNYIHRDIKPENLVIGLKKKSTIIYMLDYGLSRKYFDTKTNSHIPYKEGKNITGTVKFASIYTHMGIEQSRRDDLESLGYMMIYFSKGDLPWTSCKFKTKKERNIKIKDKKMEVTPDILCEGMDDMYKEYFNYVRKLQFEENPDYDYLQNLIINNMKKNNWKNDFEFDWCEKKSVLQTNIFNFSNMSNNSNSNNNIKDEENNNDKNIDKKDINKEFSAESLFCKLKNESNLKMKENSNIGAKCIDNEKNEPQGDARTNDTKDEDKFEEIIFKNDENKNY